MPAYDLLAANAYEVLGVSPDADVRAIRQAYRKLALMHHPDAVPADRKTEASQLFARVNRAYALLSNVERRRRYDAELAKGIVPELEAETPAEDAGFGGLDEIIRNIDALNMSTDLAVDYGFAAMFPDSDQSLHKMLREMLIATDKVTEKVIDAVGFSLLASTHNCERPENAVGGVLIVTNLRLIVLVHCLYFESFGNATSRSLKYDALIFPWVSLVRFVVWGEKKDTPGRLLIQDNDGRAIELFFPIDPPYHRATPSRLRSNLSNANLPFLDVREFSLSSTKKSPLTRLLLTAQVYRVGIEVRRQEEATSDQVDAWKSILSSSSLKLPIANRHDSAGDPHDTDILSWPGAYAAAAGWSLLPLAFWAVALFFRPDISTLGWQTALALYLPIPLFSLLALRAFLGGLRQQANFGLGLKYDAEGRLVMPARLPRRAVAKAEPPPEPEASAPPAVLNPEAAVAVEVPDAVREAFGSAPNAPKLDPASAVCQVCKQPGLATKEAGIVACARCGSEYRVT